MKAGLLSSGVAKKIWMAVTGLSLILFLVVHATINGMIWFNDGGVTFNWWAHFMGHNLIIRTMEIGLFVLFLVHIIDGLYIAFQNRRARPVRYAAEKASASSRWYSRSMALLGTLILLFLVIHLAHFWVKSRRIVGSLDAYGVDADGQENLYALMVELFQIPWVVVVYILGCFALFWHLLHGFKSAFQTLGMNHGRFNQLIYVSGVAFSIVVSLAFAMMPVSMFFGWVK
jgi:succinate dehydrogenase / fumarate reductase cytochrome b subunit